MRKSEIEYDFMHVACNDNCIYVTNGFHESFKIGIFQKSAKERKIGINVLETKEKVANLLTEKFTKLLNMKRTNTNFKDDQKINKD